MPVPKKKHSRSRQGKRRANWKATAPSLSVCPECHAPVLPHYACPSCGKYQGRSVIKIEEANPKQGKKGKEEKPAKAAPQIEKE